MTSPRRALFLDRDGTLIVDVGYPRDPAQVSPIPGAVEALRELQRDWLLVVISNQSGLGRGIISREQAAAVHERFVATFEEHGVSFAACYYCPHAPEAGCPCRKPSPGLLLDAARDLAIDLASSVMVGDKPSDLEAGRAAGCAASIAFGETSGDDAGPRCAAWTDVVRAITSPRAPHG